MTPAIWSALADRFGIGTVVGDPAYVTRGAMGEIWRLDTTAGAWAVKWQFPWVSTEARPADIAVQLAAAAAGIPLPLPVTTPDGEAVVQVLDRHARVYEWVDLGEPFEPPVSAATAAEAGRLLGLFHGLALNSDEPVDPWYNEVGDADSWDQLIDRALAADMAWAPKLAATRREIAELSDLVIPPSGRPAIVCHRDFNPDNVFPAAGNGSLMVLDWENAGPLQPDRELGYAVFCWCAGEGRFDAGASAAMLAGYAAGSGGTPVPGDDFFATAIATHLNFLQVMAEQALTEPEHRHYAEKAIADLLDRYLGDLRQAIKTWSQTYDSRAATDYDRAGERTG